MRMGQTLQLRHCKRICTDLVDCSRPVDGCQIPGIKTCEVAGERGVQHAIRRVSVQSWGWRPDTYPRYLRLERAAHTCVPLPNNLNPCSQALVVAHMITSVAKGFLVALDPSNPQIAAGFRVTAKPPIFGGIVWRDSGGSYLLLWGRTTPLVRWQHCAPRRPYQTSSRRMLLSLPPCMEDLIASGRCSCWLSAILGRLPVYHHIAFV